MSNKDAISVLQNLQGTKQQNAIQLINLAIHQKYNSEQLLIIAIVAIIEVRGLRIALDALVEEQQAEKTKNKDREDFASKKIKELQSFLDREC